MTVKEFVNNSGLKNIDAKILLEHIASIEESEIIAHPEKVLREECVTELLKLADKRKSGIPVEYLVHKKNFYKETFYVTENVLIPQPDTETLVEEAIRIAQSDKKDCFKLLDLCSGTGCIGISVAKEIARLFKDFSVVFSDISPYAVSCTETNADKLLKGINWTVCRGDLFEAVQNYKFDMILTNPPYIASDVIKTLESDVQHEPLLALDGGPTGLECCSRIIEESRAHLKAGGYILMEIGYDQGPEASDLFIKNSYKEVSVIKDLGGRDRVVKARF